ncbi:acyl-CoA dehydrogenase family protein [Kiloniella laminariae]|uniref:acyl-CoA dehydrogenase family protein n=1 Tax=Kiloniella laminariae TaxID=454162 RepID=UPI0003655811|nr:acyl-CoA dehydrogenase family protein [Kiloniella laminariae]
MSHDPLLFSRCEKAVAAATVLLEEAKQSVAGLVKQEGRISSELLEEQQFAAHGLAWMATYVAALDTLLNWARKLEEVGSFRELEALLLKIAFGEYLAQISGGIAISQVEVLRPVDMGLSEEQVATFESEAVKILIAQGNTVENRKALSGYLANSLETGHFGATGLGDETLEMIRGQFHKIADDYQDAAHGWHLRDELIPIEVVEQLAELGIFGLTVPEEYGGLGMGKLAMCVVTEELSRGYIGLGSLGTRSEIAAELIRLGGTEEQKQSWLPRISSGEILPTAVFTEPNTGSDLGSLKTRAIRDGDCYRITGNKTWITHASRSDIMTLLARTNPDEPGYKGLSMFIAEKPRGSEEAPFPAAGMSGGEIKVLGYRGMKEYELGFDNFEVKSENLLGGEEGQGFKQLMATFESARIQTAARAVGVAQCALELGMQYAHERIQFGKPLYSFPRVFGKLVWMVVETMVARQLTYAAAREKDSDLRCDIEAGMAKLLGARVAWSNADNALQIHGGNGYAEEYKISRVLCDARILNIFEGAAEIQAQVIARGLLSGRN